MKFQSGSLKEQMESLIVAPMKTVRRAPSESPIIVVLDALDEASCDLDSFLECLRDFVNMEPRVRLFITTRPEQTIMRSLDAAGMEVICTQKFMSDIPSDVVNADIRRFLEVSFQKLWCRKELLAAYPDAIDLLTERAEGLFIFARTVIQYLNCKAWEVAVQVGT